MTDIDKISKEIDLILREHRKGWQEVPTEFLANALATRLLECVPETREVDGKNIGNPYFLGFNACRAELLRRLGGKR